MSLIVQEKVVKHTEEHIHIAVIGGQIRLFPLLLGFGATKIYVHSKKTIFFVCFFGGGGTLDKGCDLLHFSAHQKP